MDRSIVQKVLQVSKSVEVRESRLARSCSNAETLRLKMLLQQKRVTTYNHVHQRLVVSSCVPEEVGTYSKLAKGVKANRCKTRPWCTLLCC